MEKGSMMVAYQPMAQKGWVNFFRMVVPSQPALTHADMDFIVDEIERLGSELWNLLRTYSRIFDVAYYLTSYKLWWIPDKTLGINKQSRQYHLGGDSFSLVWDEIKRMGRQGNAERSNQRPSGPDRRRHPGHSHWASQLWNPLPNSPLLRRRWRLVSHTALDSAPMRFLGPPGAAMEPKAEIHFLILDGRSKNFKRHCQNVYKILMEMKTTLLPSCRACPRWPWRNASVPAREGRNQRWRLQTCRCRVCPSVCSRRFAESFQSSCPARPGLATCRQWPTISPQIGRVSMLCEHQSARTTLWKRHSKKKRRVEFGASGVRPTFPWQQAPLCCCVLFRKMASDEPTRVAKCAVLCFAITSLFIIIAFSSNAWLQTDGELEHPKFVQLGKLQRLKSGMTLINSHAFGLDPAQVLLGYSSSPNFTVFGSF